MNFLETLRIDFPNAVLLMYDEFGIPTIVIRKESLTDIMVFLYSHSDFEFTFLTDLCGVHYPSIAELPEQLQTVADQFSDVFANESGLLSVVYHLHNLQKNCRVRVKLFTSVNDPIVSSITSLFSAADWMERETYDFYGVEFRGHPNLKRILNMDEMTYFPLRKEYALEDATRDDKTDSFFGRTQGNV